MKVRKFGKWEIEFPTTINGNVTTRTAFVREHYVSGFVSLYGQGNIGVDSALPKLPKAVTKYLVKLSLKVGD